MSDNAGLETDLAILRFGGSTVEQRDGYRVVRTPGNPHYHWGNFLVVDGDGGDGEAIEVTIEEAIEQARRWLAAFGREFPRSSYVAISLPRAPAGTEWADAGVPIELDDVLTAGVAPPPAPLAEGYRAVRVAYDDADHWEGMRRLSLAHLDLTLPREANEPFSQAQSAARRALVIGGRGMSFAALDAAGEVAACLGIVSCGERARYQDVLTGQAHRRRGLARHLLGLAAAWAGHRGCREWVIVASADGPAGRIYRRAGFAGAGRLVSAYRP